MPLIPHCSCFCPCSSPKGGDVAAVFSAVEVTRLGGRWSSTQSRQSSDQDTYAEHSHSHNHNHSHSHTYRQTQRHTDGHRAESLTEADLLLELTCGNEQVLAGRVLQSSDGLVVGGDGGLLGKHVHHTVL